MRSSTRASWRAAAAGAEAAAAGADAPVCACASVAASASAAAKVSEIFFMGAPGWSSDGHPEGGGRRARALARRAFRAISSTAAGHWAAMRHLLTTETNRNRGGANRGGVRKAPPGAPADVRRARAGARIDASAHRCCCCCCARIAIFDERLREARSGAVGEIVISGPCLARGYPDDPKQAAEKCLAHPSRAGERAYRMGNLAPAARRRDPVRRPPRRSGEDPRLSRRAGRG